MLLFLSLCFKLIPPQKHFNNKIPKAGMYTCYPLLEGETLDGKGNTYAYESICNGNTVKMKNCKFILIVLSLDESSTNFVKVSNSNIEIDHTEIRQVKPNGDLISCQGESGTLNISSCQITNCYRPNGEITIVNCQFNQAYVAHNFISFLSQYKAKAFYFKYHTNNVMIGNHIENARGSSTSGIVYEGHSNSGTPLQIADCIFDNVNCDSNPSIFKLNDLNAPLTFTNVTFKRSKNLKNGYDGFLIHISADKSLSTSTHLTFDNCKFSYMESNVHYGGIGLWYRYGNKYLNFKKTTFEHIAHTGARTGGGVIMIANSLVISGTTYNFANFVTNLVVSDCTFYNISTGSVGGAILFDADNKFISISDTTFTKVNSDDGHALHISKTLDNEVFISDCTFTDCGNNINTHTIVLNCPKISFMRNTIQFTSSSSCCQAIQTSNNIIDHYYFANTFKNIKCTNDNWASPVIDARPNNQNSKITIQNNVFDNIVGDAQGRCFFINSKYVDDEIIIDNNTFQHCPAGGFLFKIIFEKERANFEISSCRFIQNDFSTQWENAFGICPQIIVQNEFIKSTTHTKKIELTFLNCYFENNHSPRNGGALIYGKTRYTGNTFVILTDCTFIGNNADGNGGALTLQTYQGCKLENCTFIRNVAKQANGAAIFIETDFEVKECSKYSFGEPQIIIDSCSFIENCKDDANSAISFSNVAQSPLTIIGCSFTKHKTSNYALSLSSAVLSTLIKNCTFEFTTEPKGGLSISIPKKIEIDSVRFKSTGTNEALKLAYTDTSTVEIRNCVFSSSKKECIYINNEKASSSIVFENNIIEKTKIDSSLCFICRFYFSNKFNELILRNITFSENICNAIYGGGSGLIFMNLNKLSFVDCKFTKNEAHQSKDFPRIAKINPNDGNSPPYYNGDGGGIQIGFKCQSNEFELSFDNCNFSYNKAQRHGGAIAIQTLNSVKIINCKFENNEANVDFNQKSTSSKLLFENHYDKKYEGRGGAIYINPAYTYQDISCNYEDYSKYMTSVDIVGCKFQSNSAYDGYGIYVEGDDPGTIFGITNNIFKDNYNESNYESNPNYILGAVISTEIHSIDYDKTVSNNEFSYENKNLNVKKILYVDHYGRTTKEFTESKQFTNSHFFTETEAFTLTKAFSKSDVFFPTNAFSKSSDFMKTDGFSLSKYFTQSGYFSETDAFTFSSKFSKSDYFQKTKEFESTSDFTRSEVFTTSNIFSKSDNFVPTIYFSKSNCFTKTNEFSQSSTININKSPIASDIKDSESFEYKSESSSNENPSISESESTSNESPSISESESSSNESPSISESESSSNENPSISESESTPNENPSISESESTPNENPLISESESSSNENPLISESESSSNENPLISESSINNKPINSVSQDAEIKTSALNSKETSIDNGNPDSAKKSSKSVNLSLIIGLVVGIFLLLAIIVLIIIFVIRRRRKDMTDTEKNEFSADVNQMSISQDNQFDNPLYNNITEDPFLQTMEEAD